VVVVARVNLSEDALRQWEAVAPAWEAERVRLFEMTRGISERLVDRVDPAPGQTVLELTAGPGETGFLAAARVGDEDVTVEEVTGTMVFDSAEDLWTFNTSIAGPVAELVGTLSADQLDAVRATLGPSLAPFEQADGLELPWVGLVTTAY
jgi:hypothetical protein